MSGILIAPSVFRHVVVRNAGRGRKRLAVDATLHSQLVRLRGRRLGALGCDGLVETLASLDAIDNIVAIGGPLADVRTVFDLSVSMEATPATGARRRLLTPSAI